jgi:hypothetical protein
MQVRRPAHSPEAYRGKWSSALDILPSYSYATIMTIAEMVLEEK